MKETGSYDYHEIELFIREELSQHGEWLIDRFAEAIERGGNVDSGALLDSLDYGTTNVGPDGSLQLTVSFLTYGRMAEIMSRRRQKEHKEKKRNGEVWASKNHKPKRVEWYNRNRFAGYGRLIRRITAGMSTDERERIKGILEEARQRLQNRS